MRGPSYGVAKRLVLPGDLLGVAEEFLPGEGAYEEEGKILSSVVGITRVDPKTRKLHVKGFKQPLKPRSGNLVVGRVVDVKNHVVLVELGFVVGGEDRGLSPPSLGAIHISKICKRYVENILAEFQPGDIVLARVIAVTRVSVEMTTASPELGVISSRCGRCRRKLVRRGRVLFCPNCNRIESRKVSNLYGSVAETIVTQPTDQPG